MASLWNIAPRLARANKERSLEVDWAGENDGRDWARVEHSDYSTLRCSQCGGRTDMLEVRKRVLVGPNKGYLSHATHRKCRDCHACWGSFR